MNENSSVAGRRGDREDGLLCRSRGAHRAAATGFVFLALMMVAADWKIAEPGWRYEFPRDHHAHREFKTEWWYFTGNLFDNAGRRFGYELTFFRHGVQSAAERDPNGSRFIRVESRRLAPATSSPAATRRSPRARTA